MPDEVWVHTAGSFLEGVYGQKGPPMFLVASLVSLYYSGSVVIKITFKWLYSVYGFPFPLSATIFTFGVEWLRKYEAFFGKDAMLREAQMLGGIGALPRDAMLHERQPVVVAAAVRVERQS